MQSSLDNFLRSTWGGWLIRFLQVSLGLLFIYASLDKIWNPGLFAKSISNYRILPISLLHISAIILPWLELICGLALIVNRYQRAAYVIVGSMLIVFILAIASAMARGLDIYCGCFSMDSTESNVGLLKIIQNTGLLLCCGFLEYYTRIKQVNSTRSI